MPRELTELVERFQRDGLWGDITLQFQHGELVIIRHTITEKMENNHARNAR